MPLPYGWPNLRERSVPDTYACATVTDTALTSTKFADEGYHFWQNWAEELGIRSDLETGIAEYRETGGGIIWTTASTNFLDACYANHDLLDIPYEVWDTETLLKNVPVVDPTSYYPPRRIDDPLFGTASSEHEFFGAGFFPQAGYVSDPMLAANNVMRAAKATGKADYRFRTAVTSIDVTDGRVSGVTLQSGEVISAPIVLNAGGPHSAQLTDMAFAGADEISNDMNVNTRAMRTEVAYVSSMPEWDYQRGPTFADFDVGVYWRPQVGGQILIGSIEPECDNDFHVHLSDADTLDTGFSEQMTNQIYRELPPSVVYTGMQPDVWYKNLKCRLSSLFMLTVTSWVRLEIPSFRRGTSDAYLANPVQC